MPGGDCQPGIEYGSIRHGIVQYLNAAILIGCDRRRTFRTLKIVKCHISTAAGFILKAK